jgi:transcriptional antiterminator RfaH
MIDTRGRWFVAQTVAREESRACDHLAQKAIATYLPRLLARRRHGSRRWQTLEPLFPGYIFARFSPYPDLVSTVRWTPGVRRLLGDDEMPSAVPDEVIEYLRLREGERGFIEAGSSLAQGTRVRFRSGPFVMLEGVIERTAPRGERVRVLMELANSFVAVEADAEILEPT